MGRKLDISLSDEEVREYLATQRTVRLATVDERGRPHVVPLWFVWVDDTMFLNSTAGNVTVDNIERSGTAAGVVDDGESYDDLRGAVVRGRVERADGDPRLEDADRAWSHKYLAGAPTPYRMWRDRVWLRLVPDEIASWDFRKIPEARARRDAERERGEG